MRFSLYLSDQVELILVIWMRRSPIKDEAIIVIVSWLSFSGSGLVFGLGCSCILTASSCSEVGVGYDAVLSASCFVLIAGWIYYGCCCWTCILLYVMLCCVMWIVGMGRCMMHKHRTSDAAWCCMPWLQYCTIRLFEPHEIILIYVMHDKMMCDVYHYHYHLPTPLDESRQAIR